MAWVVAVGLSINCSAVKPDSVQWVAIFHNGDAELRAGGPEATRTVRKILMGETRYWSNGEAIDLVIPSKESRHLKGLTEVIGAGSDTMFQRHWLRLAFGGRADPPKFRSSMEEVVRYVERHPNALGVVRIEDLPPNVKLTAQPLVETS